MSSDSSGHDVGVGIRFRGNAESSAAEVWRGFHDEVGLEAVEKPERLDRPHRAELGDLGTGTLILSIVVSAVVSTAVQSVVQRGIDFLVKKITSWWADPGSDRKVDVHVTLDISGHVCPPCLISAKMDAVGVNETLSAWRQETERRLELSTKKAARSENGGRK